MCANRVSSCESYQGEAIITTSHSSMKFCFRLGGGISNDHSLQHEHLEKTSQRILSDIELKCWKNLEILLARGGGYIPMTLNICNFGKNLDPVLSEIC